MNGKLAFKCFILNFVLKITCRANTKNSEIITLITPPKAPKGFINKKFKITLIIKPEIIEITYNLSLLKGIKYTILIRFDIAISGIVIDKYNNNGPAEANDSPKKMGTNCNDIPAMPNKKA